MKTNEDAPNGPCSIFHGNIHLFPQESFDELMEMM